MNLSISFLSYTALIPFTPLLNAADYLKELPKKENQGTYRTIKSRPLISSNITGPIPTNDWWSSLVWPLHSPHSMPMFPHPLSVQAHSNGMAIGYTSKPHISDHYKDGKAFQKGTNYRFPHLESLRVGIDKISTETTLLDGFSDWAVTALWKQGSNKLRATFAHGTPFVYFEKSSKHPFKIKFNSAKVDSHRQPLAPHTVEWKNITAKHSGKLASFQLSLNSGNNTGIGSKARIVYDFDGDGNTDRVETFQLFATDPIEDTWEQYTSNKQTIDNDSALTYGKMQDFKNGTICLEIWKCFGKGKVQLKPDESSITLPLTKSGTLKQLSGEIINFGNPTASALAYQPYYQKPQGNNVIGITLNGSHFGIFTPRGTQLSIKDGSILADVPYLSVAALPDSKPETIQHFEKFAYAFIKDTKISYKYNPESSEVTTTYDIKTEPMQGSNKDTLIALYRHQHLHTDKQVRYEKYNYASPRGEMKVLAGQSFTTHIPFLGILPALPNSHTSEDQKLLLKNLLIDSKNLSFKKHDTYWNGKEFGKVTELIQIADQLQQHKIRDQLLLTLKTRLSDWFDARAELFFYYDERWDTLIGYPDSYGSADQLNDHHFHYSYFIKAAATIAQFDPDWVKSENYGKLIELLIRDCASPNRNDALFPWMRNFDPYAGHSWASGHAGFASGNNQESSSESMNFATSLILYGQATRNTKIRDLGIYWHSTEAEAIKHYWFDTDQKVFPLGFKHSCVGIVWGDGGSYGTWWTANPEEIHGINFLPINGGSLYLGRNRDYIQQNLKNLKSSNLNFHNGGFEGDPNNYDRWHDILAEYLALTDPITAKTFVLSRPSNELGETKTHSLQWITSLKQLGSFLPQVKSDHPTCVAFTKAYVTYIPAHLSKAVTVKFSDGKIISANPGLTLTPKK